MKFILYRVEKPKNEIIDVLEDCSSKTALVAFAQSIRDDISLMPGYQNCSCNVSMPTLTTDDHADSQEMYMTAYIRMHNNVTTQKPYIIALK